MTRRPFEFGLGSLLWLTLGVALLAWLGTSYPIAGIPIVGGITFALAPCAVGLLVAGLIKAVIYMALGQPVATRPGDPGAEGAAERLAVASAKGLGALCESQATRG